MCIECGCNQNHKENNKKAVNIDKSVTEANDIIAREISHALAHKGILCVNVMGSPGSGKTTFIECISKFISPSKLAVIEGDLESDIDKKKLESAGIVAFQINTHSGCHLNAQMINQALLEINLNKKEYLIIENVGNLICPANVKIGQHVNIVVSSVTEGSDKPKKYPYIFMDAGLIILSKTDLTGMVDFHEMKYIEDIKNINFKAKIAKVSKKDIKSYSEAFKFLEQQRMQILSSKHSHSEKAF